MAKQVGTKPAMQINTKLAKQDGTKLAKQSGTKLAKQIGTTLAKQIGKQTSTMLAKQALSRLVSPVVCRFFERHGNLRKQMETGYQKSLGHAQQQIWCWRHSFSKESTHHIFSREGARSFRELFRVDGFSERMVFPTNF